MRMSLVWVVFGLSAASGCAGSQLLRPADGWRQALGREHPLTGRVLAPAQQAFVSPDALYAALDAAELVLLGETHDNRDHHLLQAALLEEFARTHPGASVGFEMLDETQAAALAGAKPATPEQLAQAVGWSDSGWPPFELYRPVFALALAKGLPIVAAHPSPEHVRASLQGVEAAEAGDLKLDEPLPALQQAAQREEILASHCGHGSGAMLEAMQRAQSYKDAFMARALTKAGAPAVLIAGRGHVRNDRGVPLFLQRRGAKSVTSVAFVEVADGETDWKHYEVAPFDYVIFTARVTDEDPCELFKRQLESMHSDAPKAE